MMEGGKQYCADSVAVVTGAGGTLCSRIAVDLAAKGAKVVLVGRTREKLEKTAAAIAEAGGVSRIEPGDVTDEKVVQAIAERVGLEWGPCRYLVNGAGGNNVKAMPTRLRFSEADYAPTADFAKDRGFFDIDMEAFRSVLEINTLGTVIPSRIFGLQMARAGGGVILNFASMNTYRPLTRVAPYAMSKAAIANWTMFFAQYMAPAKVRVNAVAPGFMVNERSKQYLMTPDGGLSARGEQVMRHTPAGRFGEADDLLGCVNWLLDDSASAFVTGITVPVDGGFLASAGV
ncbi:MAG: SDR family oxidoreductase [Kiritimatiellae bacterium]|nr:SDR family oxidoreductase [Kiritimatiellia bacterium]